jgi:hypothetical protein
MLLICIIGLGIVGFFGAIIFLIPTFISLCCVSWWRGSYTKWYVQAVMDENNGQWPQGLKL